MEKDNQYKQQTFKLPYQECKIHGQKLNYICNDSKCHEQSLICSICKDEAHNKHQARPLKFYLQQLHQKYQHSDDRPSLNYLLEELQISQFTFYQKLRKTVERVAVQFQKLEEQVTQEINNIRNQIYLEIAKRNQFNQFYESLKRGNNDHSNFLIQNYLPQTSIGKISSLQSLQKLSKKICEQIKETKKDLISRQTIQNRSRKEQKEQDLLPQGFETFDLSKSIKKPQNIIFKDLVLTQSNTTYNAKSLCLIDYPVTNISGKITFKILQLKKYSTVMISVMTKEIYEAMKECWTEVKLKNSQSFTLGSNGFAFGWKKRLITQFGEGSTLDLSYHSGQLKLTQKSKFCSVQVPKDPSLFVVLSITGNCQVKINHKR